MKRMIGMVLLLNICFVSSALYSMRAIHSPDLQELIDLRDPMSNKLKLEKAALENYLTYQAIDKAVKGGLSIGQIEARIAKVDQLLSQINNIVDAPSVLKPKLQAIKASEDVRPLVALPGA